MIITFMLASLLGCTAHAHVSGPPPSVATSTVSVSSSWTWVPGHWTYLKVGSRSHTVYRQHKWISGYWTHAQRGKSYRTRDQGPPPPRAHAGARWIPGHWQGHGHHRRWVDGRWVRR